MTYESPDRFSFPNPPSHHTECKKGQYDPFLEAIAIPGLISAADLYEFTVWWEEFQKKGLDKRDAEALRDRFDATADIMSMSMRSGIPITRIQKWSAFILKCDRAGIAEAAMDVLLDHDYNEDEDHGAEPFPFFPAA